MIYLLGCASGVSSADPSAYAECVSDIPGLLIHLSAGIYPGCRIRKVRVDAAYGRVHFERKEIADEEWDSVTWYIFSVENWKDVGG